MKIVTVGSEKVLLKKPNKMLQHQNFDTAIPMVAEKDF